MKIFIVNLYYDNFQEDDNEEKWEKSLISFKTKEKAENWISAMINNQIDNMKSKGNEVKVESNGALYISPRDDEDDNPYTYDEEGIPENERSGFFRYFIEETEFVEL